MKPETVYILIDKNAGLSVNYVGIHKHKEGAEHHKFHREKLTKKHSIVIRKATIIFDTELQNG